MMYFFHLEDGTCIRDPKGEDFSDDAAAMIEAVRVARELSKLEVHAHQWRVVVQNVNGIRVGEVPLRPAVDDQGVPIPPESVH